VDGLKSLWSILTLCEDPYKVMTPYLIEPLPPLTVSPVIRKNEEEEPVVMLRSVLLLA
jgi:hypothetical protein